MPVLGSDEIKQHTYPINISAHTSLDRCKQSLLYHDLIEYMQGGEKRMDELNIPKNRRRALIHRAKHFKLPSYTKT